MGENGKVNILLVDDQPAKLLTYEAILSDLGENLIKASSGTEALRYLLKTDVAVVLMDVSMPELDGFELAAIIRQHPRYQKTAIIFVSAVHLTDLDRLKGYQRGAVDYVSVPIIPEILRAKVSVFAELYRKTQQLEELNRELEQRVAERTADLEISTARLRESEERLLMALDAANAGSFDWDIPTNTMVWSPHQFTIFGLEADQIKPDYQVWRDRVHPDDIKQVEAVTAQSLAEQYDLNVEYRVVRLDGSIRWVNERGRTFYNALKQPVRMLGVTIDITERKQAEERAAQLFQEAQLLNAELEQRVMERTSELQTAYKKLEEEAAERERAAAERNELQRRLMESRENERLHLAQELHDGPMQELHAITFHLAALQNSLCDESGWAQLAAGQAALQQVLRSLRMTATELRPSTLIPFGLAAAIRSHAEEFQKRYPELETVLELVASEPLLPERVRLALFRIYQHALMNTVKHAQARRIMVRLSQISEQLYLEIEDDGCGFEMPAHWIELARQGHLGLVGMTERAEAVGGRMRVISASGKGTLIQVSVPYSAQPVAMPAIGS
jgi:PAS domain S-box-containing protein